MTDMDDVDSLRETREISSEDLELTLERAETLVARAQEVFETTVEVLRDTVRTLKTMPDNGDREVLKDVRAMNSALQFAMDMQEKARVAGSTHFGGGTGGGASTWTPPGTKSALDWRAFETPRAETAFLDTLSENALAGLAWLFEFWALPHQCAPEGDWRTWVVLGGRGAGKTRAGTEWVRGQVEGAAPEDAGVARRVALIGETYDQAVAVMVKGDSGLLACSPPDRRPRWVSSERRLVWPNGAEARVYSANDPEALRGPQFDCAWADELAKWPRAREAWDMLQFGLRLGDAPRAVVTTTPRNVAVLRELLERESTVTPMRPPRRTGPFWPTGSSKRSVRATAGRGWVGRRSTENCWRRPMTRSGGGWRSTRAGGRGAGGCLGHRGGRPAGDGARGLGRLRDRGGRGDRGGGAQRVARGRVGRLQRDLGQSRHLGPGGGAGLSPATARPGWWPRSTRAATWSRW
jgi:hypothetical protein